MKKLQKTIITASLSILAASAAVNHISAVNAEELQPAEGAEVPVSGGRPRYESQL